jgi:hypothetical protein
MRKLLACTPWLIGLAGSLAYVAWCVHDAGQASGLKAQINAGFAALGGVGVAAWAGLIRDEFRGA